MIKLTADDRMVESCLAVYLDGHPYRGFGLMKLESKDNVCCDAFEQICVVLAREAMATTEVSKSITYPSSVAAERIRDLVRRIANALSESLRRAALPVDMLIFCPKCRLQHVDAPHDEWTNPPHRTHECQGCGHLWRIADIPTNGVATLHSKGRNDGSPIPDVI